MQVSIKKSAIESVIYISLLLAFSGNPVLSNGTTFGKIAFPLVTFLLVIKNINFFIGKNLLYFYFYILVFILVFIFQRLTLGFISYPAAIALIFKVTLAYVVIRHFRERFRLVYLNAIYVVSIISLFGFFINFMGFDIPRVFSIDDKIRSIVIFTQNGEGSRNSGMFWEPGAFACYIILAFLFHLGNIRLLLKDHLRKTIILFLALLSTFSTTGYIVLFLIIAVTLLFEYSRSLNILIAPVFLALFSSGVVVYETSPFLKEKIDSQMVTAKDMNGEFANTRFGALFFDFYYIKKHPWVGNGLHQLTRYADHPWLQNKALGHGNGFSNFLASMGVLSFAFYAFLLVRFNKNYPWIFLIGITALLQGEQLMNYPLFLGLPLVFIYGKKNRHTPDLP